MAFTKQGLSQPNKIQNINFSLLQIPPWGSPWFLPSQWGRARLPTYHWSASDPVPFQLSSRSVSVFTSDSKQDSYTFHTAISFKQSLLNLQPTMPPKSVNDSTLSTPTSSDRKAPNTAPYPFVPFLPSREWSMKRIYWFNFVAASTQRLSPILPQPQKLSSHYTNQTYSVLFYHTSMQPSSHTSHFCFPSIWFPKHHLDSP